MEWIKSQNTSLLKNEIIGLQYESESEFENDGEMYPIKARLKIYLRNGAMMELTGVDAVDFWGEWNKPEPYSSAPQYVSGGSKY